LPLPHLPSLAGRRSRVVACSLPPPSLVPHAAMHLPALTAWLVADACLVYLVLSLTVTAVCAVLPLASVLVMLMVLPATEATVPCIADRFAGEPDGAGVVEPGPEPGAPALACGHLPSAAARTRTVAAVTGWPPWDSSWPGCTVTQLPVVTSVSAAGTTSLILVDGVKSTVALPFSFWVT